MTAHRWQRIEELYHDAAARPERERASFLENACAGDDVLKREVESLLAQPPDDSFLPVGGALAETPSLQAGPWSAVGSRIGGYQILRLLGAGGMGEVYCARDARLHRDVAIKVLPPDFAAVPDRAARFEREARLLASLNHPNIASIYGFEREGQSAFLILELIPGDTLLERISRGPLPVEEALRVAKQIADALEAAHDKGIVHRDLKPANIKITDDDRVKVLDFGLAKAMSPEVPDDPDSAPGTAAPTITTPAQTRMGLVLGTAAYMSPEQARGKSVDKRSDIWAFGCVMYEMLAGRRAFISDEVSDTIAFVLTKEPDWQALPAATPDSIRRLLRRCLEKNRARRLADIADARIEIEDALAGGATTSVAAARPRRPVWRQALPWALAATATAMATLLLVERDVSPAAASVPVMRMSADIGVEGTAGLVGPGVALSPDGSTVAFVARDPATSARAANQLFVRRVDQLEARPLAGTESALSPFFSPDGKWIGFFATGALKKVAVAGGAVVTLCNARVARGADWLEDGTIVFQDFGPGYAPGPLMRVSDAGGKPAPVFAEEKELAVRWPQMLPGGRTILATAPSAPLRSLNGPHIVTLSLPDGERKVIGQGQFARYVSSGHLIYGKDGTLFAAPFDVDRLELTGPAVPVVQGVRMDPEAGNAEFSVSEIGTLVYVRGSAIDRTRAPVHWLDRRGQSPPLHGSPLSWSSPRFSPDGRRIALTITDSAQNSDIWIYEWERDILTRLTTHPGADALPVWSPDSRWIAYGSQRDRPGIANLYAQRSDGTGEVIRLTDSTDPQLPGSWHPSGNAIAFHEGAPARGQQNIGVVLLAGDSTSGWKAGTHSLLAGGPGLKALVSFSPTADGSPIPEMNRASTRCTSGRIPARVASGRFRAAADLSHDGRAHGRSCCFAHLPARRRYLRFDSQSKVRPFAPDALPHGRPDGWSCRQASTSASCSISTLTASAWRWRCPPSRLIGRKKSSTSSRGCSGSSTSCAASHLPGSRAA
jgi:serine/threonine-protein kinase